MKQEVETIASFLRATFPEIDFLKVEPFRLVHIEPEHTNPTHFFAKEIFDDLEDMTRYHTVFKCVPLRQYAQVYKHYTGMADKITKIDRMYVDAEGRFKFLPQGSIFSV